ncbi:diversity-generating retroelement protein Avd [Anabaena sp. UHCC 0253]|uniref:diversity-generating retroelement protein Avd n=1 Tax=Anabaena sp. UHCC 0253 TaxID=2590019 RepID=UPI001446A089|nr:diversity-generating retroelement protein Avd [Anabaena sp. UHCC 0253]MTJ55630.1 diversity-generating retroelement protein Avd [Anabaena sp. UHCC 0253]
MSDLPIIQKTYDLIKWYVPILDRLPKNYKFGLGDRIVSGLYDLLEGLILARYAKEKIAQLELLNAKIDVLRHQTRLLFDFEQFDERRYEYVGQLINEIGNELGGWIKQQKQVRQS